MPVTKSTRAEKRVDPAIVSAVAREVTPKLVRALQSAVSLTAYEAVEHALAKRDKDREDREIRGIAKQAAECGSTALHLNSPLGAVGVASTTPELVAAIERVHVQLDRVIDGMIEIEAFTHRLTGSSPVMDQTGPVAAPSPGNPSAISGAWMAGDRVSALADRLQALVKHLNSAA